jgi:hypothetical protein
MALKTDNGRAGFEADEARRNLCKEREDLAASQQPQGTLL